MSRPCVRPVSGLEIMEKCLNRAHREELVFANLSPEGCEDLSRITVTMSYPPGAQFLGHQESGVGVYIVCRGRVNISVSVGRGKALNCGAVGAGDLFGLTATMSGAPCDAVAEVMEPSEIKFIPRTKVLEFLRRHGDVAVRIAEQLCATYNLTLSEMRRTGFSQTTAGRFARFLLECPSTQEQSKGEFHIELTLTHKKIGEIIGVRRETLTRVFNRFKRMHLLKVRGGTIIIRDRAGLENLSKG